MPCRTDSQQINSHSCFPIYPFNPFPWMLDVATRLLYLGPWIRVTPIILRSGWSVEYVQTLTMIETVLKCLFLPIHIRTQTWIVTPILYGFWHTRNDYFLWSKKKGARWYLRSIYLICTLWMSKIIRHAFKCTVARVPNSCRASFYILI